MFVCSWYDGTVLSLTAFNRGSLGDLYQVRSGELNLERWERAIRAMVICWTIPVYNLERIVTHTWCIIGEMFSYAMKTGRTGCHTKYDI